MVVDLSTASPQSTQRIHAALAQRGVELLDAGISGGAKAADAGTLTIMVGGDADALDRVRPILERFASKIFHMGDSGAGHIAKLLNNFLNGISLAATAEVMVAAKLSGLDLETFLDVLNASSGVNFATLNRFPHIIKGDYLEGGLTGRLMAKDIRLYLEHVARLGVPTFNGPQLPGHVRGRQRARLRGPDLQPRGRRNRGPGGRRAATGSDHTSGDGSDEMKINHGRVAGMPSTAARRDIHRHRVVRAAAPRRPRRGHQHGVLPARACEPIGTGTRPGRS